MNDEPMALDADTALRLHRGEITVAEAFGVATPAHRSVQPRYAEALAEIEQHGSPTLRDLAAQVSRLLDRRTDWSPCARSARMRMVVQAWEREQDGAEMPAAAAAIAQAAPRACRAYVVGKGPSLDRLGPADFPDRAAPVVCCNEAIHRIEELGLPNPVFAIQQDRQLGARCRPKRAVWLVSRQAWNAADAAHFPGAVQYDPEELGGSKGSLTANQALRYLACAGIRNVTMLAFDAAVTGDCDYAEAVGAAPDEFGKPKERFLGFRREMESAARYAGMKLTWMPPPDRWRIVCVLKSGGQYRRQHVDWLRRQVAARVKTPHDFVVLTDIEDIPGSVALRHRWRGWWSKLELFRPDALPGRGPVLYLDLDVVLCDDIELPAADDLPGGAICARVDWWRPGQRNSSVMMWRPPAGRELYVQFSRAAARIIADDEAGERHGDQAYISRNAKTADLPALRVRSYRADGLSDGPADAQVAVFHGRPKPWEVDGHPWIPAWVPYRTRRSVLVALARLIDARTYVELGVCDGSTMAHVLRYRPSLRGWGIDLFRPQPGNPSETYESWDWVAIQHRCEAALAEYGDRAEILRMTTLEAVDYVPGVVDLVFIDADHSTAAVAADIESWLPRIRPGGILAGHDIDWPTVRSAVERCCPSYHIGPDNVWYCYRPGVPSPW